MSGIDGAVRAKRMMRRWCDERARQNSETAQNLGVSTCGYVLYLTKGFRSACDLGDILDEQCMV